MSARRSGLADRLRITPGALAIAGLEVALSLVWLMSPVGTRAQITQYVVATPTNVIEHGRVWTLATSPFLDINFISLLLNVFMLWMLIPTLERFWGTARFYRFFAITSLAGTVVGTAAAFALQREEAIAGLSPFMFASLIAFGVIYARQPVQLVGVLPLTGRQLMWAFVILDAVLVLSQQAWAMGAAHAAAMLAAAVITSKRWSPGLAWRRWRIARARAKLSVIEGGKKPTRPRDEQKWLN
ncbi:MAG TPA: rhomboid family intramembrane serine protease [Kofleriaceae bacterium]|nr:rhomboid family intramembrane serine protease [Kofleriaceae bacterium]